MANGKPFGCSQDVSLSISTTSSATVGCREDAQSTGPAGLVFTTTTVTGASWSVTPGALFRFPEDAAQAATMVTIPQLQILQIQGAKLPFVFSFDDDDTGYSATYSGTVVITDSTLNAPLADEATGDFTFTGDGNLTIVETLPTA